MDRMVGLGKESRDRVFGEDDLDGISINETVNAGEKHKGSTRFPNSNHPYEYIGV